MPGAATQVFSGEFDAALAGSLTPRIQQGDSEAFYVFHVPSDQCQPVNERRGGKQTVFRRDRTQSAEPPPFLCDFQRDRQDALGIQMRELRNPFHQRVGHLWIRATFQRCAPHQFPNQEHTQKILISGNCCRPSVHLRRAPFFLSQLRQDVSVEQEPIHSATLRGLRFRLRKMLSSSTSGIVRRKSIKGMDGTSPTNERRKIRRASSSADTPSAAALARSLRTTALFNCRMRI